MEEFSDTQDVRQTIKQKLRENFDGKIVRKDLTKKIKEGANVPVYVLEFLLGQYCSSDDDEIVAQGVENVKRILADNYVRPDESEKVLSKLRQRGSMTIIDQVTVNLNLKNDAYEAFFSNLGLGGVPISEEYPEKYDRLLCGGIWSIIQLEYGTEDFGFGDGIVSVEFMGEKIKPNKKQPNNPIRIRKLTPIQMPHVDIEELKQGRKAFSKDEWIDVLLRSIGMESDELSYREKWLLLLRMIPLVENNFNLCELGPRSTGKSHLYKEISPNSILVSGGQTTVANLFYNMGRHTMGLVGMWDCVAFDEVAGIHFKDKDGIQIMKDYMASGSFARGKDEKAANASMVFVGNINQSVDVLLKTSSLFDPFPTEMGTDTAFLDRMHCYVPGWEIPKFRPEHFTDDYGFITDYLAEFLRELRKEQHGDALDRFYRLGKNLNQRDTIVDPAEWELVQQELARRKSHPRQRFWNNGFGGKIVCGECGAAFGPKVWHSTDAYRRTVWQCNRKYQPRPTAHPTEEKGSSPDGEKRKPCSTPHLTEEQIKAAFCRALSTLLVDRDKILADGKAVILALTDCTSLDKKAEMIDAEIAAVAARVDQLVRENAAMPLDQDIYSKRYNELAGEYEKLQRKREAVEKEKRARAEKREALETFYGELEELEVAFTPQRWNAIVERVVVGTDGALTFLFVNGGEVTV